MHSKACKRTPYAVKSNKLLNWNPQYDIDHAMHKTVELYKLIYEKNFDEYACSHIEDFFSGVSAFKNNSPLSRRLRQLIKSMHQCRLSIMSFGDGYLVSNGTCQNSAGYMPKTLLLFTLEQCKSQRLQENDSLHRMVSHVSYLINS